MVAGRVMRMNTEDASKQVERQEHTVPSYSLFCVLPEAPVCVSVFV